MKNITNENYERFAAVYDLPERSISEINDALQKHLDYSVVSAQVLGSNQLIVVYQKDLTKTNRKINKKSSTLY